MHREDVFCCSTLVGLWCKLHHLNLSLLVFSFMQIQWLVAFSKPLQTSFIFCFNLLFFVSCFAETHIPFERDTLISIREGSAGLRAVELCDDHFPHNLYTTQPDQRDHHRRVRETGIRAIRAQLWVNCSWLTSGRKKIKRNSCWQSNQKEHFFSHKLYQYLWSPQHPGFSYALIVFSVTVGYKTE